MSLLKERNEFWYQRDISFKEFTARENMCTKTLFGVGHSQWSKANHAALNQRCYESLEKVITSNKNTFAIIDMIALGFPEFYQWIEASGHELKEPK